jgi:HSP20 family protein
MSRDTAGNKPEKTKPMTMVKFHPRPFERTFNSLFEDLFQTLPGRDVSERPTNDFVPVNIRETKEGYVLDVVAPGLEKSDFKVSLDKNVLTVSAERKTESRQEEEKTVRREFSFRSFSRSFRLDEGIDATAIRAKYENGILQLTLPKRDELKIVPKDISIQ